MALSAHKWSHSQWQASGIHATGTESVSRCSSRDKPNHIGYIKFIHSNPLRQEGGHARPPFFPHKERIFDDIELQ